MRAHRERRSGQFFPKGAKQCLAVKASPLRRVDQSGARDLYVISTEAGEVLYPAVKPLVVSVDPDDAILIRPVEGFFPPEKEKNDGRKAPGAETEKEKP